jgi:hypothetical protein
MNSIANGYAKSNGKVSPMNDDTHMPPPYDAGVQEIENTNVALAIPNDPIEPTQAIVKKSFLAKIFKKDKHTDEKKDEPVKPKKPPGPKLKSFEIVRLFLLNITI